MDFRAYLKPKNILSVLGDNVPENILQPFYNTNGALLFPYTPTINGSGTSAIYESYEFTHSNFAQQAYQKSRPKDIAIDAMFTAQTVDEARYMLAVIHFLRTVTKGHTGEIDALAGLPPPVLLFNYLGAHMFNNVPVVVTDFTFNLPDNVDYVETIVDETMSMVPTELTITILLSPQYNPDVTRKQFSLEAFRKGKLLDNNGRGFI